MEIVDIPIKNGDFPVRKLLVYQRAFLDKSERLMTTRHQSSRRVVCLVKHPGPGEGPRGHQGEEIGGRDCQRTTGRFGDAPGGILNHLGTGLTLLLPCQWGENPVGSATK